MSEFSGDELLFRQRSKQRDDYWIRSDKSEDEVKQLQRKLDEALAEVERLKAQDKVNFAMFAELVERMKRDNVALKERLASLPRWTTSKMDI